MKTLLGKFVKISGDQHHEGFAGKVILDDGESVAVTDPFDPLYVEQRMSNWTKPEYCTVITEKESRKITFNRRLMKFKK